MNYEGMGIEILSIFAEAQAFVSVKRRRKYRGTIPHSYWFDREEQRSHRDIVFRARFCEWCAARIYRERGKPATGELPRFCSRSCSHAAYWFKRSNTETASLTCEVCGQTFDGRGWVSRRKYCGQECKTEAKKRRNVLKLREYRRRQGRPARQPRTVIVKDDAGVLRRLG